MTVKSITMEQYNRISAMTCPDCWGDGEIIALTANDDEVNVECPKCDGMGYIDQYGDGISWKGVLELDSQNPKESDE